MLRKVELEPRRESFLSGHRIPELTVSASTLPYPSLTPVWEALNEGRISDARELVHSTMQERRIFPADERAALLKRLRQIFTPTVIQLSAHLYGVLAHALLEVRMLIRH